MVSTGKRV